MVLVVDNILTAKQARERMLEAISRKRQKIIGEEILESIYAEIIRVSDASGKSIVIKPLDDVIKQNSLIEELLYMGYGVRTLAGGVLYEISW